jgi:hypothetical protein
MKKLRFSTLLLRQQINPVSRALFHRFQSRSLEKDV